MRSSSDEHVLTEVLAVSHIEQLVEVLGPDVVDAILDGSSSIAQRQAALGEKLRLLSSELFLRQKSLLFEIGKLSKLVGDIHCGTR